MTDLVVTKHPIRPPTHPGAVLREDILPALGISISEFSRKIGVSRQQVHKILAEERGISPEMALRIGKFVGNGAPLWATMQQRFDLWKAENDLSAELSSIHQFNGVIQ